MIYTNLIYFLIVIVLFSAAGGSGGAESEVSLLGLAVFPLLLYGYYFFARRLFRITPFYDSANYFKAEKIASISALALFAFMVYGLDLKSYLAFLSFKDSFPSFVNIGGLTVFFGFFMLMWAAARKAYEVAFSRAYTTKEFLFSNFKANLPLAIPWIMLSVCYDLLLLIPSESFQQMMQEGFGDIFFFLFFLCIIVFFAPPVIKSLWGCKPLPEGEMKEQIIGFCARQEFSAKLLLWPLFEGKVITAGVMGILPRFRYLLFTPAILESMNRDELEAVLAHEIGHVKKHHLIYYVLIVASFSFWITMLGEPALQFLFSREFFIHGLVWLEIPPVDVFIYFGVFLLLVCLVLFFRFLFGYFIRNFERQADLYVFRAIGNARGLKSSFEKIAVLSGNIRNKPSWHHFGIGERVDFLEQCERDPGLITAHDRKVNRSLIAYLVMILATVLFVGRIPSDDFANTFEQKYTEAYYMDKVENGAGDALVLRQAAHYMLIKQREDLALRAYNRALVLAPDHPEVLNNSAWLLLTARDGTLRDPDEAMRRVSRAASIKVEGYILDTLAMAHWAQGRVEEAVQLSQQAAKIDTKNSAYYLQQARRFQTVRYEETLGVRR